MTAVKGAVDQDHRMLRLHAAGGQMHRASRIGAGHDIGVDMIDPNDLSISDLAGQLRLHDRICTPCPAAQTIVVQLDKATHEGLQHCTSGAVNSLYVAEVTRILNSDTQWKRIDGRQLVDVIGEPFLNVEDPS